MKGTEKQIKYANDIRKDIVKTIEKGKSTNWKDYFIKRGEKAIAAIEKVEKALNGFVEYLNSIEDAKYIIENYQGILHKIDIYDKFRFISKKVMETNYKSISLMTPAVKACLRSEHLDNLFK